MEIIAECVNHEPNVYLFCYASTNSQIINSILKPTEPLIYIDAYIKDYTRIFAGNSTKWKGGISSIYPKKDSKVYGILITLNLSQLELFDKTQCGYYREKRIAVIESNGRKSEIECYTYFKENIQFQYMPSTMYLNAINLMLRERTGYKGDNIVIRGIVNKKLKGIAIWQPENGIRMKL
tara:strand:+ start:77 stop:613 length:537 start_codon:yes stop_codon:yes gene_type:complete